MTTTPLNANEVLAEVLEHFALELRFTLSERDLQEAPEAVAALYRGRELLIAFGGEVPHVVNEVLGAYSTLWH